MLHKHEVRRTAGSSSIGPSSSHFLGVFPFYNKTVCDCYLKLPLNGHHRVTLQTVQMPRHWLGGLPDGMKQDTGLAQLDE